jgi:hypothetical protein
LNARSLGASFAVSEGNAAVEESRAEQGPLALHILTLRRHYRSMLRLRAARATKRQLA